MAAFIQWCLDNLNYWTITLLMTIESSFIPFPSEVVVPPAAYHAASNGQMDVWLIILFATIGSDLGAIINYYLAYFLGRPIVYRFANSKLGHLCLIDQGKVEYAEQYFNQHGVVSTFVGRLITVVRQLISIPAGLARMHFGKFILFTTLGAGIWNIILSAIGYYLQRVIPEEQLLDTVTKYSHEIGLCILVAVALVIGWIWFRRKAKHTPPKEGA